MKPREKISGQCLDKTDALRKELGGARKRETELLEAMQSLEAAFQKQVRDLEERVKELECLFNVSKLTQRFDLLFGARSSTGSGPASSGMAAS